MSALLFAQELVPVDPVEAGGIDVRRRAVVLFGSPLSCSRPATIRWPKVLRATPEWKTIRNERIRSDTARYALLMAKLTTRIKAAARRAADHSGCDCVVRRDDLLDSRGLAVRDLTDAVTNLLGSS